MGRIGKNGFKCEGPSQAQARVPINMLLEQGVRSLLPRFEAKIQRVLDRV